MTNLKSVIAKFEDNMPTLKAVSDVKGFLPKGLEIHVSMDREGDFGALTLKNKGVLICHLTNVPSFTLSDDLKNVTGAEEKTLATLDKIIDRALDYSAKAKLKMSLVPKNEPIYSHTVGVNIPQSLKEDLDRYYNVFLTPPGISPSMPEGFKCVFPEDEEDGYDMMILEEDRRFASFTFHVNGDIKIYMTVTQEEFDLGYEKGWASREAAVLDMIDQSLSREIERRGDEFQAVLKKIEDWDSPSP